MRTEAERVKHRESVKRHYRKNPVYRAKLRASAERWRLANIGWTQLTNRLRRYGITLDQLHAMFEAQLECCAICKEPLPSVPDIDHNHRKGTVRGLLCHGCNSGLGMFRERAQALRNAAIYVERWV